MVTVRVKEQSVFPVSERQPIVEAASSSILGTRNVQQDACWVTLNSQHHELLAVVCDGMGGLSGGEQASQNSIQAIAEMYRQSAPVADVPEFYRQAAMTLNQIVMSLTTPEGTPLNAGTTIISVMVQEDRLYWFSIGDSRIYFLRNCEAYPCCEEHNYETMLRKMLASGEISPEEAAADTTRRDALTSYLGMPNMQLVEISEQPTKLEPGDLLILCSDGLYKSLSDDEIRRIAIENRMDLHYAADALTAAALSHARGAQDNTTVVLVKYNGDPLGEQFFGTDMTE